MASESTVASLIQFYTNCLIIQYHNQPNAQATIAAYIAALIQNGVAIDVQNAYNLETAVGVQLDVLGKYADLTRFYEGQSFTGYFGFSTYSNSAPAGALGFSRYSNYLPPLGKWLIYDEILSTDLALTDSDFRTLLLLRIIQNNCNFSRGAIDKAIFDTFGLDVIPDSTGNMIMDYLTNEANAAIMQVALQQGVLPKPMGVWLRYLITEQNGGPFFGFATYTYDSPLIAGFSTYANYNTIAGETLIYADLLTG